MLQETFPASHQDTTLANAALDLRHVGQVAAHLEATGTDRGRLARAITVLLTSVILETAELGVYRVQSACQPGTWYTATTFACDCPDATQRQVMCKHSLAPVILSAVSAIQARERAEDMVSAAGQDADILDWPVDQPIPFELTEVGLAALAASEPACECFCHRTGAPCYRCAQLCGPAPIVA